MPLSIIEQMRLDAGQPADGSTPKKTLLDQMREDAASPAEAPAAAVAPPKGMLARVGDAVGEGVRSVATRAGSVPGATYERGFTGNIGDAFNALGHNLLSLPRGIDQKLVAGGAYLANRIAPGSGFSRGLNDFGEALNDNLSANEQAYQKATPDSLGAVAGATAGQVAPWLLAAPAMALKAAGNAGASVVGALPRMLAKSTSAVPYLAPVTNTVAKLAAGAGRGAAQGAAVMAPMPITGAPGMTAANIAAMTGEHMALGALIGPAAEGVGAGIIKPALNVVNPMRVVGQNGSKIFEGLSPDQILAGLRSAGSAPLVPNSLPTTAQVGGAAFGVNNMRAVQLEKLMRNTNQDFLRDFNAREANNNGARWNELHRLGASDADMAALKDQLAKTGGPLYDKAYATPVQSTPELEALMATPNVRGARAIAESEIAPNDTRVRAQPRAPYVLDPGSPASPGGPIFGSIQGADGNPITMGTSPPTSATMPVYSVEGLHDTLKALSSIATDRSTPEAIARGSQVELQQQQLRDWLTANSPDFTNAQQRYAQTAAPINNAEAANAIAGKVGRGGANGAGDDVIRLRTYENALDAATNPKRVLYPPDGATTDALGAVAQDLKRASISNSGSPPGSATALLLQSDDWLSRLLTGGDKGAPSGLAR